MIEKITVAIIMLMMLLGIIAFASLVLVPVAFMILMFSVI